MRLIELRNDTLYKNTKCFKLQQSQVNEATLRNRYIVLDEIENELPEPRVHRIFYDFPPREIHFSSTSSLTPKEILNTIREKMSGQQGPLLKLSTYEGVTLLEPYCEDERKTIVCRV